MELILGHNQFIGVSHTSEDKSIELQKKFSDAENIYKVVETAADIGYRNMIIETHPKMLDFLNIYKKNQTFDMNFYLQVPNIQGYVSEMNEKGLSGLILELVHRGGVKSLSSIALKNMLGIAKKDYTTLAKSALQLEVSPFLDVNIKALLLHNVSTDLLLSLRVPIAFSEYIEYVRDDLDLDHGFVTLNFSLFKTCFEEWGFGKSLVMTPLNVKGFDMNPSKDVVEKDVISYKGNIIAMNVLGGGAFSVNESYRYLMSLNKIKFCVVGASSREHLQELEEVFNRLCGSELATKIVGR